MSRLRAITLAVRDMARAEEFFTQALDFERIGCVEARGPSYEKLYDLKGVDARFVHLRLGEEDLHLVEFLSPEGRAYPADSCSNDLWFQHMAIVVSDMDAAHDRLVKYGVKPISWGPQTIPDCNKAAAGVKAFYFRSPNGHPLELIYFPQGKGAETWQQKKCRSLFLGIDHTAIAVADTPRSLAFYRDVLQLRESGGSLNHGSTQEALSGVPGARVQITSLRPDDGVGMGLEFLQYLHPPGGRRTPGDLRANDHACTWTVLRVQDLDGLVQRLKDSSLPMLSEGVVNMDAAMKFQKATALADPDGHRLLLVQDEQTF